jgi:hypothetical protein
MQAYEFQFHSTRDALVVCSFERHLGHAFRFDAWHAFDATRLNASGDGFLYLGRFDTREGAREAIAASLDRIAGLTMPMVMAAGSRYVC